jgi:hypothetical protein
MAKLGSVILVALVTISCFAQEGNFKGKVVIAGTGPS